MYKPIFDKLDALAVKRLNELDKSVLWSRHYTKTEFKYSFLYPLIVFSIIIIAGINYGVKYRLYMNYIKYGRELELREKGEKQALTSNKKQVLLLPVLLNKKADSAFYVAEYSVRVLHNRKPKQKKEYMDKLMRESTT